MKKTIALFLFVIGMVFICACGNNYAEETIKFNKNNVKTIAHRGLSGMEIENTESAFVCAGQRSYYGIEADVRKTLDGQFIICHDDTLKRLCGQEIVVEESNFSDLINVVLYDKYGSKDVGERLTDLSTFISICKRYQKQAIVEFKSNFTKEEINGIIETIKSCDYINSTTFISFNYNDLLNVKEVLPNNEVHFLTSKLNDEIVSNLIRDKINLGVNYKAITKEYIDLLHNAGLKVNCWTVDSKQTAEKLVSLGVDYITTNILE